MSYVSRDLRSSAWREISILGAGDDVDDEWEEEVGRDDLGLKTARASGVSANPMTMIGSFRTATGFRAEQGKSQIHQLL